MYLLSKSFPYQNYRQPSDPQDTVDWCRKVLPSVQAAEFFFVMRRNVTELSGFFFERVFHLENVVGPTHSVPLLILGRPRKRRRSFILAKIKSNNKIGIS